MNSETINSEMPVEGASLKWVKARATLAHLCISIVIFSVMLFVVISFWYPPPYFTVDGGWVGIRMVAFIDIVLGPLLTFIVYKPGKPGLKMDLSIIGMIQILALLYGVYTLYSYRAVSLVYVMDSFYVRSMDLYSERGIKIEDFEHFPGDYPKPVYVVLNKNAASERKAFLELTQEYPDYTLAFPHYEPLRNHMSHVVDKARDIESYLKENPEIQEPVGEFLRTNGGQLSDYAFIPMYARYYFYHIGVRRDTGEVAGVLEVEVPYPNDIPYLKDKAAAEEAANTATAQTTE